MNTEATKKDAQQASGKLLAVGLGIAEGAHQSLKEMSTVLAGRAALHKPQATR